MRASPCGFRFVCASVVAGAALACAHAGLPVPGAVLSSHAVALPAPYLGRARVPGYTFFVSANELVVRKRAESAFAADSVVFTDEGPGFVAAKTRNPDQFTNYFVSFAPDGNGTRVAVGALYVWNTRRTPDSRWPMTTDITDEGPPNPAVPQGLKREVLEIARFIYYGGAAARR